MADLFVTGSKEVLMSGPRPIVAARHECGGALVGRHVGTLGRALAHLTENGNTTNGWAKVKFVFLLFSFFLFFLF
jgi:hypothetical protein